MSSGYGYGSRRWIDECWRLVGGLAIMAVAGFLTGFGLWFIAGFLLVYCAWMIFRFNELELWLRDGGAQKSAPDAVGIASEIMQLIYRDKKFRSKQHNRLRASLTRFNDMAAELPDATIVLNEEQQIVWSNSAAGTLLGINRKTDAGQRVDNLVRSPEFQEFIRDGDTTTELELQSPSNVGLTIALRLVRSGDSTILTGRDITQRVVVREMRKAFVADVSHELRSPLTVIQGYLEVLNDDPALPGHIRDALANVTSQSDRMREIVEDLLTLSRLESSQLAHNEGEPVPVSAVIHTLVTEIDVQTAGSHPIEKETDDQLYLLGKQNEIHSACQNLLSNAIKYTPPGTRLSISWKVDQGEAQLLVRDTGPGIEAHHLPRLSERFYRADKGRSRETGGTGLGLAIVKYIAQRHGGQLLIRSEPGTGSEFEIRFPAERIAENPRAKHA